MFEIFECVAKTKRGKEKTEKINERLFPDGSRGRRFLEFFPAVRAEVLGWGNGRVAGGAGCLGWEGVHKIEPRVLAVQYVYCSPLLLRSGSPAVGVAVCSPAAGGTRDFLSSFLAKKIYVLPGLDSNQDDMVQSHVSYH